MLLNIRVPGSFGKLTKRLHSAFNVKSVSLVDSSDANTYFISVLQMQSITQQINWLTFAFAKVRGWKAKISPCPHPAPHALSLEWVCLPLTLALKSVILVNSW